MYVFEQLRNYSQAELILKRSLLHVGKVLFLKTKYKNFIF